MGVIIYGGTGQCIVDRPLIEASGHRVVAVFDDTEGLKPPFDDVPLLHGSMLEFWRKMNYVSRLDNIYYVVAIGNPHGRARLRIAERLNNLNMKPIHVVALDVYYAHLDGNAVGAQIMPGVVIQPRVEIGNQVIVNTNASVDHECVLDDGCEVGPGATLCGNVHLETCSWVGAGSVVLPRLTIGHDSIVGAGSVVTKNIPANEVWYGNPARYVRNLLLPS